MKTLLSSVVHLCYLSIVSGATYTFQTVGEWSDQSNWDVYPGTSIHAADSVIVSADLELDLSVTIDGYIEIGSSSSFMAESVLTVHGEILNYGNFIGQTQINLFGDAVNHGDWELTNGTLIITNTATFYTDGEFINNSFMLGYNSSVLTIEGNFTNNDDMTINSIVNINLEADEQFINEGFCQYNGPVRLEGKLINSLAGSFNVNPSSLLTVANNSNLTNSGILNVKGTCHLSSMIQAESTIGNTKVTGSLVVIPSITEIL